MTGSESRPRTLAEKIDRLFATFRPLGGKEHTYKVVVEAIQAKGGPTISVGYLWQLRKGVKDNPTKKQLEALADFFGVPPAYFFDDEAAVRIEAELALLGALRDAEVREIAFRAVGLSPQSLYRIAELIDHVRQLEGLPTAIGESEIRAEEEKPSSREHTVRRLPD